MNTIEIDKTIWKRWYPVLYCGKCKKGREHYLDEKWDARCTYINKYWRYKVSCDTVNWGEPIYINE